MTQHQYDTVTASTLLPSPSLGVLHLASSISDLMTVDASLLEGGGQVLRNIFAYSALTQQAIHLVNIRANRPSAAGLRPQHFSGLLLVQQLVGGQLRGLQVGVKEVIFQPATHIDRSQHSTVQYFTVDTGTAASVALLIQSTLPICLFLPFNASLTLRGGTNATQAPLIDYTIDVLLPTLGRLMQINVECSVLKRGLYPRGGGVVEFTVKALKGKCSLKAFDLTERGLIVNIGGEVVCSGSIPLSFAQSCQSTLLQLIQFESAFNGLEVSVNVRKLSSSECVDAGAYCRLTAHTSSGCLLSTSAILEKKSTTGQSLAQQCFIQFCNNVVTHPRSCVDEYLQDQLIIFMALAEGVSHLRCGPLTLHTLTAIHWAQVMTTARFTLTQQAEDSSVLLTCQGSGYKSRFHD